MPRRALTPCTFPGCGVLGESGRCPLHRAQARAQSDARRGHSAARGYGWRWRKYREQFLREHPLCKACELRGQLAPSTDVDHISPVSGPDDPLFWDPTNHQALCHACHSSKTASTDGGFGRPA